MSLSTQARLSVLQPFMSQRIGFILAVAEHYGGKFVITSVNRSAAQQSSLYQAPGSLAVFPGCSQHQYGLAVDVLFERQDWQNWYLAMSRNFGLTTVDGDPVHVQGVSGARFRESALPLGLCPDPAYRGLTRFSFAHPDGQVVTLPNGGKTWVWNTTR